MPDNFENRDIYFIFAHAMIYYTYKTTLLKGSLKGFYYLGKHSTKKLNDGYCGSGKIINKYFKKYHKIKGKTYLKEILCFYDTEEEAYEAETLLIGDKWKTDPLCLNMVPGGKGYFTGHNAWNKGTKGFMSSWNKGKKCPHSPETIEKIKNSLPIRIGKEAPMYGKHHSEKSRQAMSRGHIGGTPWNKGLKGVMPEPWNKTQIISVVVKTGEIEKWNSLREAETELGLSHSNISACLKGRRKTCGNRTWKYA